MEQAMSNKTARILLVISNQLETNKEIYAKVADFRKLMDKFETLNSIKPEYFLLYVGPHVPSYALQTPEMIQYATTECNRGKQILHNVGHILNIPVERQQAVVGCANLQAHRIAKLLKADKVLGYSKSFIRLQSFCKVFTRLIEKGFKINNPVAKVKRA